MARVGLCTLSLTDLSQDQAFFIPWTGLYLAAKLSVSPHGIKAYNWSNKVEPWMEFWQLGYTVQIYLSTNCIVLQYVKGTRGCKTYKILLELAIQTPACSLNKLPFPQ